MVEDAFCSLSELNQEIFEVIQECFEEPLWVVAEVAKVTANYSGHTYLDLVERKGSDTLAQAKATIWRSSSHILKDYQRETGETLKAGMQVLVLARVDYHPVYGLSLNIQRIDSRYTLGEMARKRQEVIDRLTAEGLINLNRDLIFPSVPLRVAVITSATAAGWEDFQSRLRTNAYGYSFTMTLFPASVQGDGAEASIVSAMQQAFEMLECFDVLVILRGGGGVVDLSCFDSYGIASAIAICPLPVITGIGHERDTSVADLVAYWRADTPTAAAEYLIDKVNDFDLKLSDLTEKVASLSSEITLRAREQLSLTVGNLASLTAARLNLAHAIVTDRMHGVSTAVLTRTSADRGHLEELATRLRLQTADAVKSPSRKVQELSNRLMRSASLKLERSTVELDRHEAAVRYHNPQEVLRRGYTITRVNGRVVRSISNVQESDRIDTTVADGRILSVVEETGL